MRLAFGLACYSQFADHTEPATDVLHAVSTPLATSAKWHGHDLSQAEAPVLSRSITDRQ
jgi:hypothetical protein